MGHENKIMRGSKERVGESRGKEAVFSGFPHARFLLSFLLEETERVPSREHGNNRHTWKSIFGPKRL